MKEKQGESAGRSGEIYKKKWESRK